MKLNKAVKNWNEIIVKDWNKGDYFESICDVMFYPLAILVGLFIQD